MKMPSSLGPRRQELMVFEKQKGTSFEKVSQLLEQRLKQKADLLELSREGIIKSKVRRLERVEKIEELYTEKLQQFSSMKTLYEKTSEEIEEVITSLQDHVTGAVQGVVDGDGRGLEEKIETIGEVLKDVHRDREKERAGELAGALERGHWQEDLSATLGVLTEARQLLEEEIEQLILEIKEMEKEMAKLLGLHVEEDYKKNEGVIQSMLDQGKEEEGSRGQGVEGVDG